MLSLDWFHNVVTDKDCCSSTLARCFFLERTMHGVSHTSVVLIRLVEADEPVRNPVSQRSAEGGVG